VALSNEQTELRRIDRWRKIAGVQGSQIIRLTVPEPSRLTRVYSAPEVVAQRAATRAALAACSGERGLDIGCGPGLLSCELAREVGPDGRIVGIDTSAEMVAATRARAAEQGLADLVETRVCHATRLEFPEAAFDFVVAVQVYLYVAEIGRALAEVRRILKRGGRAVIVDTGWDSCVWLTNDRDRHRRIMEAGLSRFAQPHLPPRLPGLLREAGLQLGTVELIPIVDLRYDPDSLSGYLIGRIAAAALGAGVPPDEVEAWAADLRGRTTDGDYFFSLSRYLFVAFS
jgi:arsenite methyltransferase